MKKKTPKKYEDKLFIDMPFDEALERFAGVKPAEMHANNDKPKKKKKKPPGGEPSSGKVVKSEVVQLRDKRKMNRS
jgi:hypothetical protein